MLKLLQGSNVIKLKTFIRKIKKKDLKKGSKELVLTKVATEEKQTSKRG